MNKYEKKVIGKYELHSYDLDNTLKNVDDFSQLKLDDNKTFCLIYDTKKVSGNWSANDYGDWTVIEFEYQNKIIEAQVGLDEISFNSLDGFGMKGLNAVKFTKFE